MTERAGSPGQPPTHERSGSNVFAGAPELIHEWVALVALPGGTGAARSLARRRPPLGRAAPDAWLLLLQPVHGLLDPVDLVAVLVVFDAPLVHQLGRRLGPRPFTLGRLN